MVSQWCRAVYYNMLLKAKLSMIKHSHHSHSLMGDRYELRCACPEISLSRVKFCADSMKALQIRL